MVKFGIICKELDLVFYDTGKVIYEEMEQDRSKYCALGHAWSDGFPSITTRCRLFVKNAVIQRSSWLVIPCFDSLLIRRLCGTESNAFLKSVYIMSMPCLGVSNPFVQSLRHSKKLNKHEHPHWKPSCSQYSSLCWSLNSKIRLRTSRSRTLTTWDVSDTGR